MRNIVLIPNITKDKDLAVTKKVATYLSAFGASVYIDEKYNTDFGVATRYSKVPSTAELLIVVGGDGSVIDASMIGVELEIPVLGINLGHLGYLAEVEIDEIETLSRLFSGQYEIEEKMLLSVDMIADGKIKSSERFAVNDIIISHDKFLGISDFSLTNNQGESIKYRADGIALSTPVGSTAYSLSAGGPIVGHDVDAIVATPVCPHSFFNRSIVFRSDEALKLKNNGTSSLNISVDGRFFSELKFNEECIVRASEKRLKMLTFNKNNMFSTLFGKMNRFESI